MTADFKTITERLNNTNESFIQLGDFYSENKKTVVPLIFDTEDAKLTLVLPSCLTKAGIIESSNKTYTDLMFDNSTDNIKDMNSMFLELERITTEKLHSKSDTLFSGDMTLDDFEEMFNSNTRLINRGANICIRVNIPSNNKNIKLANNNKCSIYNKNGEKREICDIKKDTEIIPLIEISDIHITPNSINLNINLIECMILNDLPSKTNINRRIKLDEILSKDDNKHNNKENNQSINEVNQNINNSNNESIDLKPFIEPKTEVEDNKTEENQDIQAEPQDYDDKKELKEDKENLEEDKENLEEDKENLEEDKENLEEDKEELKEDKEELKEDNYYEPELTNNLEEVTINLDESNENDNDDELLEIDTLEIDEDDNNKLIIKQADEVYKELYKNAITKAKKLRTAALDAYLEAKNIKAKFMLKEIYDSDGDEDEDDAEYDELKSDY
jgi:hypothetical protein